MTFFFSLQTLWRLAHGLLQGENVLRIIAGLQFPEALPAPGWGLVHFPQRANVVENIGPVGERDANRRRAPLVRPPANLVAIGGAVQFRLPDGIDLNNILPDNGRRRPRR